LECQAELVEAGLHKRTRLRQTANDTYHKWLIANKLKCQPEPVEGGVLDDSTKFDKLTLTDF
jgi:hypothetical protein